MTSTDRRVPLWQQVLDDLEDRLASGEITDRFPTDRELVAHYEVSRHTVREAVRRLNARGIVERERGRGSHVTSTEFVQSAGALYSLFRAVEDQGHEQTSRVLVQQECTDAIAAQRLSLPPDSPLVCIERLRLADGVPLALDTAWLPHEVGAPLLGADMGHTSLYDTMERLAGVRPDRGEERITAVAPSDELREVLEVDDDEGVLRLDRRGSFGARAIESRVTFIRGSRFSFVARWPHTIGIRAEIR